MKSVVVLVLGALVLAFTACGGGEGAETRSAETAPPMRDAENSAAENSAAENSAAERSEGTDAGLPAGCGPRQAADLVAAFAVAVAEHRREKAIDYLSKNKGFVMVTIYHGKEPGAGRVDSRTPAAAYDNFINTFGAVEKPALIGIVVGSAPFEWLRRGAEGDNPTAGVGFAIRLGARSLTGKIGIDCATGTIYVGGMNVRQGLRPQKMCGGWLSLEADRPKICAYPTS